MTIEWNRLALPLAVALAAGAVASWVALKMLRRGRRRRPKKVTLSLCPTEQRRSTRDIGLSVPVQVSDRTAQAEPTEAVMVDCSQGGLRLLGDQCYPVGTVLSVRGTSSKKAVWLRLRVRNCLRSGPRWEVGCQFVRRPSRKQLKQLK